MRQPTFDLDTFGYSELLAEARALSQELPIEPGESVMYVGRLCMTSPLEERGCLTLSATHVRWTNRDGMSADFNGGTLILPADEARQTFGRIWGTMGAHEKLNDGVVGTFVEHEPWNSAHPDDQTAFARRFALSALNIQLMSANRRVFEQALANDRPEQRRTIEKLANINLYLAQLTRRSSDELSHHQAAYDLSKTWSLRRTMPGRLSWLTG